MNFITKIRNDEFRTFGITIVSGIFLIISFFKWFFVLPADPAWIAIIFCGVPIVYGAVKGLFNGFDVTADVLVAIALIAAVITGEFFAAGEVAFIMQIGKVLEDYTAAKSHKSLRTLINLAPQKAHYRTGDGDIEILASEIKVGDLLLVRPGEVIPADGRITYGSTAVNQAVMTGESIPCDRTVGDLVYQGTLNQQGAIEIEATSAGDDSSLKKMIHLVEEAEKNKAPIVRIADKWARILVPVALGCALLILFLTRDIYRAVTALVVFCPCSLILATPTAMMAAIGNATKKGIIIKSGSAVEAVSRINMLVMDKTGTLTYGEPQVDEIIMLNRNLERSMFLSLAASSEKISEHPLGKAFVEYARKQGISAADPETFEMTPGKGIKAQVDGHEILIGEKMIGREILWKRPEDVPLINRMKESGKTVIPVAIDGVVAGIILIADDLRSNARSTIAELKKAGLTRIVMLTGDNQVVADAIGQSAGVTDIFASQLPEDKVNTIKDLTTHGYRIAMVGDGINDAPALATASVGIAMGAMGSDVAMEAADIALMNDDISKLPFLVKICRKTRSRIVFNIVISMMINFCAIILAGFGILNPVTAALVHNCGSVFVVINSALLLSYREE